MTTSLKVGIIGAGANTRLHHIPKLRAIPGVEVTAVCNRTKASTEKAAAELEIGRTFDTWQELVADDQLDAIVIGTWPYLHSEITCAALAAGKHVLCEARMASNLAEAHLMLEAAEAHPDLVVQIVPSPFGLKHGALIQDMLAHDYLGELREVVVIGATDVAWDHSKPLHWRFDKALSGENILAMGILHETVSRWIPKTTQVFAQTSIFEPTRPDEHSADRLQVEVPDSVQIATQIEGGARGMYHISGQALFGPGHQIHLYGSHATIKWQLEPEETLQVGRMGQTELQTVDLAAEKQGCWQVEEDFIAAIRGEKAIELTDVKTAFEYMRFTDAVHRSAQTNQPVSL